MKTNRLNPKRILAIDPTSRGFGFVVLESATTLADWGVKRIQKQDEVKTLERIAQLIAHYEPEVIVLEDCEGSRRCARVKKLLEAVVRMATNQGVTTRRISMSQVKKVFITFRASTKYEIAHAVARQLPELTAELPPPRKDWMSEHPHMAIFDAAAFALTYFYSRGLRTRGVRAIVPELPGAANIVVSD